MRVYIIISILFVLGKLQAQDTLFIKDKEPLLVRVLEISKVEVSYKFFFNPDGVIYKVANSQVMRIVYENGKEESRFQLSQKTSGVIIKGYKAGTFIVNDNHISIDNRDITHKDAFKIMLKRDPQVNSDELNSLLLNAESKKSAQIGFTIAGPVFLIGGLYVGRRNYYGPKDKQKLKTFVLSGLSLFIASEITGMIYKSVKNRKIRKAALLYNKEISF